jgi:outer membrane protein assembly factor BamA
MRGTGLLVLALCAWPFLRTEGRAPGPPADTDSLGVIDTVIVIGNESTREYVILDEMTLRPGSVVTERRVEYDRNRIYALGLFTSVDLFFDPYHVPRVLTVLVRERWHLIPYPIFGFRYGDPKKIYFGVGLLHNNLGGTNKKLYASLVFGYDPSFSLYYLDPLLDRDARLSFAGNASYSRNLNKSETEAALTGDFFDYRVNVSPTIGKRFSLHETGGLTVGYQSVRVSIPREGRTVSDDGSDQFLYATIAYTYDTRDLAEYASRGIHFSVSATKNGFGESEVNSARYAADARGYLPLGSHLTLAGRVYNTLVSGGEVPTYNQAYFGYSERLRGYFKEVFEGEDLINTSAELRFFILPPRTITADFLPLPPEFVIWRFGIALTLFADAGTIWVRGTPLTLGGFRSGYGGGVNFLLPYGIVLRTEYAWNNLGEGEFILDFRTSI